LALSFIAPASSAPGQSADLVLCDRVTADPADPDKPKDIRSATEIAPTDIAIAIKEPTLEALSRLDFRSYQA
jgi:uncharacterized protein